jgi:hypothetical protein
VIILVGDAADPAAKDKTMAGKALAGHTG